MSDPEGHACASYIGRLGLDPLRRVELLAIARAAGDDPTMQMAALHDALSHAGFAALSPAFGSIPARLALALDAEAAPAGLADQDAQGHTRLVSTPRFNRSSMAPYRWLGNPFAAAGQPAQGPYRKTRARGWWSSAASARRALLGILVLAQAVVAAYAMAEVMPYKGTRPLEMAALAVFVVLFAWISAGFWTAIAGFALQLVGRDRHAISAGSVARDAPIDAAARTAIVMPICNEDVKRAFAGLRATCESLARTGHAGQFDVFVLSDTGDADVRVAETSAWLALRHAMGDGLRVFYRWRQHRIKRKSGNIADFCRRWGKDYRYMVVLDADSVMSGDCLVRLAQLMEANPGAGIIQTAPRAFGRDTLFARIHQFAAAAYGPLFTAGLHFWQMGESHYWGHNAILRVEPFMAHCALGRLPGSGPLSGEVLSHDFVEAALMRRAGWAVWIAYDLDGSYEEMPPNLLDELARDRRWCQGNLMNLQLFRLVGLHPVHRAVFMIGVMAYVSAPLWFLSLMLGTGLLAAHSLMLPTYFTEPHQLFPRWPEWHPDWALMLFGSTAFVLFLPKLLAVLAIWLRNHEQFGRGLRAAASVAIELVFSALFAPIRMIFHTQFVAAALTGMTFAWKSPPREDSQTGWVQATKRHGASTVLGIAWLWLVAWLEPAVVWWILPVAGSLAISIPLSVISSSVALGRGARRLGLFVTPEELRPPEEILRTQEYAAAAGTLPALADAVMDPLANAIACANATPRERASAALARDREGIVTRALANGLDSLDARTRSRLLNDPIALSALHFDAWTSPGAHESWVASRAADFPSHSAISSHSGIDPNVEQAMVPVR